MAKRILLFFPFCFTARSQGNELRVVKLLEFFSRNCFTVDILSYQNRDGYVWNGKPESYPSGRLELVEFGGPLKRLVRKAIALLGWPIWKFSRIDIELIARFRSLVRQHDYSHIIVSYADWAYLLRFVHDPATRKMIDTHDIWSLFERGQGRVRPGPAHLGRALGWELGVLGRADTVIAIAPFEQAFFSNFLGNPVELVPVGFDSPRMVPSGPKTYDLLYVGSGNKNNVEGLRWFLSEVLRGCPHLRVAIAGSICNEMAEDFASFPNVTPVGFIKDLATIYQQARASICPMIGGTGVKVKVIEALAHGVPVIGSSVIASCLLAGYERACHLANDATEFKKLLANLDQIVGESRPLEYAAKYSTVAVESSLARIFRISHDVAKGRQMNRAAAVAEFECEQPLGVP